MVGFSTDQLGVSWWKLAWRYLLGCLAANSPPGGRLQRFFLRRMGLIFGRRCFFSPKLVIDPVAPWDIHIGSNVFTGWNARLFVHVIVPDTSTPGLEYKVIRGEITVEDDVFLGAWCLVTPIKRRHVTIGRGAIVGDSTYVDRDVPAGAMVVGRPFRIVGWRGKGPHR